MSNKNMPDKRADNRSIHRSESLYLAFVDTPGLFASIIRRVLKQRYVHVVLSLDPELDQAYSVGRRVPSIPLIAGFEKEEKELIYRQFPDAYYQVCRISCTKEQKREVQEILENAWEQRFCYHYAILGLFFLLAGKPFYHKGFYTCSSYVARILEETGVLTMGKHFSMVTPKDFYEYEEKEVLYEGPLEGLVETEESLENDEKFGRMSGTYSGMKVGDVRLGKIGMEKNGYTWRNRYEIP